jgi:vacuolar-type H+-ATPase subunit E/Vma4
MTQETEPGALFNAMEQQAGEERARIRTDAEARAGEILAAADAEIARLKTEALRALEKELAVERQRMLGEALMTARIERLRMKRRLLAEAFRRAGEAVERRKTASGYPAALQSLAAEARSIVGDPCRVEMSAEDGAAAAVSPDGRRRADNGLASRLRRAEAGAEPEVARRLFAGPGRGA